MKVAFNEKSGKKDVKKCRGGGGGVQRHSPLENFEIWPSKRLEITFSALKKTDEITFPQCKNTHRPNERPTKSLFLYVKTLTDPMKDRRNHFSSM